MFNINKNKLKYLRTNTYYSNTGANINALVDCAADATPIVAQTNPTQFVAGLYYAIGGSFLVFKFGTTESQLALNYVTL